MIAITARGRSPDAEVDIRFGRCAYLVFFNPADGSFSAQVNSFSSEGGGAGVRTAQFLSDKKVEVLLTGNVGPKAMQVLRAAEIKVFTETTGTVRHAVEAYQEGQLKELKTPSVEANFGRGPSRRRR